MKAFRAALCALFVIGLVGVGPSASAHESRKVGPYEFVVGWGDEPAYSGFKNSVSLGISDVKNGEPVNELGGTLNVEVAFGGATTTLEMEPAFLVGVFGEEGSYEVPLIPTRAGEYSFTFTGTIQGEDINETFTCGEETFNCIADQGDIQFPERDPSNAELADRLEQELPRVSEDAQAAADDVSGAKTLSYVGLGLGALALVLALVSFARGRS